MNTYMFGNKNIRNQFYQWCIEISGKIKYSQNAKFTEECSPYFFVPPKREYIPEKIHEPRLSSNKPVEELFYVE